MCVCWGVRACVGVCIICVHASMGCVCVSLSQYEYLCENGDEYVACVCACIVYMACVCMGYVHVSMQVCIVYVCLYILYMLGLYCVFVHGCAVLDIKI